MHGCTQGRALARDAREQRIVGINPSIAYYITSHGYGHGVRSCSIIRAINELCPRVTVHVVTELPVPFLSNQIRPLKNPIRAVSFDVGMVQLDSIRVDVGATLRKAERLYFMRKKSVESEADILRRTGVSLIVADIPGLPLEAAALAGIPRVAVGNFGWDWIYSDFVRQNPRWQPVADMFREQYAAADLLLRLPFCEEMSAFPRVEDIPLVANPGRVRRQEISEVTGCDPGKKWILLSFTTLDWGEEALGRVERIREYEFLTVLPLQWKTDHIHALSREQIPFSDVIASADAVVSKPGFGILSDCVVNGKPLIYTDRVDFLEYPVLEASVRKYLKNVFIPATKLYAGDLRESLDMIWKRPAPPFKLERGGDRIAARKIAGFL
jgi:hypothetical protein